MRLRDPSSLPLQLPDLPEAGSDLSVTPAARQSEAAEATPITGGVVAGNTSLADDDELVLDIGPVAHGGHCVARIGDGPDAGRVVFVRHALPGERVRARLTDRGKVWRANAVEVLASPSPDRVPSVWPEAGAGGVGGGELAHVSIPGQQRWKAAVIGEQLQRLAGINLNDIEPEFMVESLSTTPGYRTRVEFITDANGKVGMSKFRSNDILPLTNMPLAAEPLQQFLTSQDIWQKTWPPNARLTAIVPAGQSAADGIFLVNGEPGQNSAPATLNGTSGRYKTPRPTARNSSNGNSRPAKPATPVITERLNLSSGTYQYKLAADGFWQVHEKAPQWLVETVLAAAQLEKGQQVLDLYSGAGLFTLPVADVVGKNGKVTAIEGNKKAAHYAKLNAANYPQVAVKQGDVARILKQLASGNSHPKPDVIILDPPRVGAGKQVVTQIAALKPSKVIYVACDPAALARDIAYFAQHNYQLTALKAADLFPMTHHVECIATLEIET